MVKKTKNNIEISKNTKAANALLEKRTQMFWSEIRKLKGKTNLSPSMIDNCHDEKDYDISEIFASKKNKLLNSVPSPEPEMVALHNDIKESCCPQSADREVTCQYKHTIDVNDVAQAVTHIKLGKSDGHVGHYSDHIKYASGKYLYLYLCCLIQCLCTGMHHTIC